MSYNDPQPRFALVREDTLGVSEVLLTGSPAYTRHDEVQLLDGNGRPCAVPIDQSHADLDHRREYTDGTLGQTARLHRHNLTLAVDYLLNDTRRVLERWKFDRARVLFTPGWGQYTDFAWRPCNTPLTLDLTGTYAITNQMDGATSLTWDEFNSRVGVMRNFSGATGRVVKTPFGAGQVFCPSSSNLMYTGTTPPGSYPVGTSDADSGWALDGTWSADLTRAFVASGFGPSACPGALRVYSTVRRQGNGSDTRGLKRVLPSTITGTGSVWVSVWMRGRCGSGSSLSIGSDGGILKTVDLAGRNLGEWTCVPIGCYAVAWPGNTTQWVKLNLTPAITEVDDCDVMVGPIMCAWESGTTQLGDSYPQWIRSTRATGDALKIANYTVPRIGTMFFTMYCPPFVTYDSNHPLMIPLFCFSGTDAMKLYISSRSTAYPNAQIAFYFGPGGNDFFGGMGSGATWPVIAGSTMFAPNKVATVAITWDNAESRVYVNGRLLVTRPGAINPPTTSAEAWLWSYRGAQSAWPMIPLGCRIENVAMSQDEVADFHATVSTAAAIEAVIPTRGRSYMIRALPSTARGVSGEAQWIGQLPLEQVRYTKAQADVTSKEL